MLKGPQASKRTRKKPINTRTRARTDYQQQQPVTRSRAHTDYQQQKQKPQPQQQQTQDDLLDLFGSFATNNHNNDDNNNSNPFDAFGDFGAFDTNNDVTANTMNGNGNTNNNKKPKKKKKKKERKKKEDPPVRTRAATVQTKPTPSLKSTVKMKKIDVLPLLHKGVRANKFKLNGNKSKVRTFYLTDSNFYFCWEAVGAQNEKKGLFGKTKTTDKRSKIDKDRSIPIRAIRTLQKNPAYMMQSYNFIPPQQKALTLSIVYTTNGVDKKLNFMSYEPFHHQLFFEGMNELIAAARDPKRNLSEVFELYVDFPKEILPKHLRPQRFKWEPLGDNDFNQQNESNKEEEDTTDQSFRNVDVYDPTQAYGRERVKSF
eukprot:166511_1